MTEFKQIIGRGTRVRDDYGKLWFNILDYTGSATRLFADPAFDGPPARLIEEELLRDGDTKVLVDEEPQAEEPDDPEYPAIDPGEGAMLVHERRKFYYDGGQVEIAAHLVYELDPMGKQLRVVRYTDYAADAVRTLVSNAPELRQQWTDPTKRADIISRLEERGVSFDELAETARQPDADPFDLLCHLAFNAPLRTRRERAQRLRSERKQFFERYSPEARAVLNDLLDKYAEHGNAQFVLPDILRVPPLSEHGTVTEISAAFGGADVLRQAVTELQNILYAA
jgi:type I restriction enzyme R subunit